MGQLEDYKILEKINSGGNGTVFLAQDSKGCFIAIKVLHSGEGKRYRKKRNRFIIETNKVIEIQDEIKGIIPIIDYALPDEKEKKYWYAMPIAVPIKDKLKDIESLEEKVECILELAETLKTLHKRNIVHRDIKPQNIYYYDGRFCLGDFGLVDYPERKEVTSLQEPVGPRATMAPEMRYNAKNADGKKADVYSLAKTLWILLKDIEYGFEGRYDEDNSIIGLRSDQRYRKKHLVELEELLKRSTEYDPDLRPDISKFIVDVRNWLDIAQNFQKRNLSEWKYIQNKLFPNTIPMHVEWEDIDSIICILNYIGSMPGLNHMFIPTGGGQDIEYAEKAEENGCISLMAGGCNYILKPQKLELVNFGVDYIWSYFRLELHNIMPISDSLLKDCREMLIEDTPGHYITSDLMDYARYDDGTKFPEGYRQVDRFIKGSFVIFSKKSVYNRISGTYDARHDKMDSVSFKRYIANMRKYLYKTKNWHKFFEVYEKDPFKSNDEEAEKESNKRIQESIEFDEFIKENWKSWNFKDICEINSKKISSKLEYAIYFHINGGAFGVSKYISKDGNICEEKSLLPPFIKENKYLFKNYEGAVSTIRGIEDKIKFLCHDAGIVWQDIGIYFTIELFRIDKPNHLFNKDEIRTVLKCGNDFRNNTLVIDENGYVKLVDSDIPYERNQYPVVHEGYSAKNNYVGQYSSLARLDETYISSLQGWLHHLKTGRSYYVDYVDNSMNEEESLEKIRAYY